MTEIADWWNVAAARVAQGRMPRLLRPLWWAWRLYNSQRPTSIFGRVLHLCFCWFTVYVVLNGAFLEIPKDRVWGWAFLAVALIAFCQACGRRKVKIVERPVAKPVVRLHAVPDADAVSGWRPARWQMRTAVLSLCVLAGFAAQLLQH